MTRIRVERNRQCAIFSLRITPRPAIYFQQLPALRAGAVGAVAGAPRGRQADHRLLIRTRAASPAAAAGRRPSVARRTVLDHARVGADRVAAQVLRAGVPVVLAVLQRGVVHFDDRVLIARIVLAPPGKAREIVVAEDHDVDAVRRRDLLRHGDAFQRFDHHRDEHVVVDRLAVVQARPRSGCTVRRRRFDVRTADTGSSAPRPAPRGHRPPWER